MPQLRPTFSDVEEITKDGNYGIEEDNLDMIPISTRYDGSKTIQEVLAQQLDAAQKVLASNHAKVLAAVALYDEKMKIEVARLRQGSDRGRRPTSADRRPTSPDSRPTSRPTSRSRVTSSQQQDLMSNGGDHGYFSSSRGRWATPDKLANSNFAKWDIQSNIREASPPGTVRLGAYGSLYGNGELDSLASNSRGFVGKKGQRKGTPFDLASVPVPLEILAGRQPPTMPQMTPAHLQDIGEVKASQAQLRHVAAPPPGTPDKIEAPPHDAKLSNGNSMATQPSEAEEKIEQKFTLVSMNSFSAEEGLHTALTQRKKTQQMQRSTLKRQLSKASKLGEEESEDDPATVTKKSQRFLRQQTDQTNFDYEAAKAERRRSVTVESSSGGKTVFADAEQMKEKVRAAIGKPEYNVTQYYHESGCCQKIARSTMFENITLFVIALNAIWIGYDTDYNDSVSLPEAHIRFQIAEHLFCAYFAFEWTIRFGAFARKVTALQDSWFVFDSVLMCLMVTETWIMYTVLKVMEGSDGMSSTSDRLGDASILKLLRLLRLTRMARMVRLLRAMPELMILIKGMFVATRSVFFTLCLLMVIIYIFGIAFTQLTVETAIGDEYFSNIFDSMNTLLLYGTLLEDTPDVVNKVGDESVWLRLMFLVFILLASLTVMNMLVGVLVEVVSVVSSVEKEQLQVNFVKTRLFQMTEKLDSNSDGLISKHEFEQLLQNPEAARALRDVGVDAVGLIDYHDFLFAEEEKDLSFANFMEIVLSLRGTNQSTVKDIVDLRKFLTAELGRMSMAIQEQFLMNRSVKSSVHPRQAVYGETQAQ